MRCRNGTHSSSECRGRRSPVPVPSPHAHCPLSPRPQLRALPVPGQWGPPRPAPLLVPPVRQLWPRAACLPGHTHEPCGLCLAPEGPSRSPRGARTDRRAPTVAGQGTQSPVNRSAGTPGRPSPGECAGSQAQAGPLRREGGGASSDPVPVLTRPWCWPCPRQGQTTPALGSVHGERSRPGEPLEPRVHLCLPPSPPGPLSM